MIKKEINKKTEEKIIDVATEVFAARGFEGASTREICNKAGVNISLISYYFGGKQELYQAIIDGIVSKIIKHVMSHNFVDENFDSLEKAQKIEIFLKVVQEMIDYFYSDAVSDSQLLLLVREQFTSKVSINSIGFQALKGMLASILGKSENDKEIIFRCLTIIGQIHSARILTQFSLKSLNQEKFSEDDIKMIKSILSGQVRSILEGVG